MEPVPIPLLKRTPRTFAVTGKTAPGLKAPFAFTVRRTLERTLLIPLPFERPPLLFAPAVMKPSAGTARTPAKLAAIVMERTAERLPVLGKMARLPFPGRLRGLFHQDVDLLFQKDQVLLDLLQHPDHVRLALRLVQNFFLFRFFFHDVPFSVVRIFSNGSGTGVSKTIGFPDTGWLKAR